MSRALMSFMFRPAKRAKDIDFFFISNEFFLMASGLTMLTLPQAHAGHSALTLYFLSDILHPPLVREILFQPGILARLSAIGNIAGHIQKLAFLFTGRTFFGRGIRLKGVSALFTSPFSHCSFSFQRSISFSNVRESYNIPWPLWYPPQY